MRMCASVFSYINCINEVAKKKKKKKTPPPKKKQIKKASRRLQDYHASHTLIHLVADLSLKSVSWFIYDSVKNS